MSTHTREIVGRFTIRLDDQGKLAGPPEVIVDRPQGVEVRARAREPINLAQVRLWADGGLESEIICDAAEAEWYHDAVEERACFTPQQNIEADITPLDRVRVVACLSFDVDPRQQDGHRRRPARSGGKRHGHGA